MCLFPKLIINPKYTANKKNKGIIPELKDERIKYVPVGCGNCLECRKQKSREWQVRLNEEIQNNVKAYFVTLTFDEPSLIKLTWEIENSKQFHKLEENEVARLAVRRFLERWRKRYKKSLRHWLITELGHTGTERIHLHGIIWQNTEITEEIINKNTGEIITKKTQINFDEELQKHWQYGLTDTGKWVNEQTINYIVKYVTKIDIKHKGYKPKILCSSGIGGNYFKKINSKRNKYKGEDTQEYYITKTGLKLNLNTYYRNKLYSDEEREKLWIQKLDKQERWICGEKINISKSEDSYYKTLKYYQSKNKILGYGDNTEDWDIKMYKKSRKLLKQLKRNKK